eukprot:CAMPEP_0203686862 /NCGR_PEP_ID=MMETSP0090-20130426/49280_1 /ASSEMBLY_ACC=CAM_ASM_001088 /TAXON_ID=426623 /ORGANISM="Chaetoceros affinis, Strain CCMP159" /LENGTH=475 /DNA_ID=CAMNT_0050556105 /DNA_START=2453 /DNA_END=3880 /DNA_ORIENTATION=+
MAWGTGNFKSCASLLNRIENDDSQLTDLVILPMKTFGGEEVKRLAEILKSGKNKTLKSISASGHAVPQDALELLGSAIASQNGNKIGSIAIGDEQMGDIGVVSFCKGLGDSNGGPLESADFAFKGISKEGAEMIGKAFGASKNLQSLILYRNPAIGDDGLHVLCTAALESSSKPFPALRKLDLSDCNIGLKGVESLVKCLLGKEGSMNEIRDQSQLIDLNLNSNPIGSDSCASLKNLISIPSINFSMVHSLSLKGCSIGDGGIEAISSILQGHQCKFLTTLDLSSNGIGLKGALALGVALKEGKENINELKEIRLADNPIGEEGITALANSLAQHQNDDNNSTLAVLDLSNTNCGSGGAVALMKCSPLSSLRLFNNNLGSTGIEAISSHLEGGHAYLKHLDLGGNRAEGGAISQLLKSIMTKRTDFRNSLNTLELGGNENGDERLFEKVKAVLPELDIARDREAPKDLPDGEKGN